LSGKKEGIEVSRKTGLVFFPAFDWAITPTHPEREERLLYTRDQLFEEGVMDLPEIVEYKPRNADYKDIARVHFCVPDISAQITEAHLIAAGGTLVLADAFMNKEIDNGFALVRPPGHHSMRVVHGNRGFCNIHNEAIMIEYLRKNYGLQKIAIVDTDVHHGDGTQDIYYHDPDVLFISFHQDGRTLYPGSGFCNELGGPTAYGTTINIPLLPNTTDEGIHYVLDQLVLPLLEEFQPDIIINSAGQDNHYTDPLANMRFTARGYARLNEKLKPDLAVLEGGYAIESALPYVNMGIILAMAGIDYSWVREPDYRPENFRETPEHMAYLKGLVEHLQDAWHNREEMAAAGFPWDEEFFESSRMIYYDTDNIREQQQEKIRLCKRCPGYQVIRSRGLYPSGRIRTIQAIVLHRRACPSCQEEARELYRERIADPEGLDIIYLQDKPQDRYHQFTVSGESELQY
jgi:acetoin utilization deacetylase AcuC-like enzyme